MTATTLEDLIKVLDHQVPRRTEMTSDRMLMASAIAVALGETMENLAEHLKAPTGNPWNLIGQMAVVVQAIIEFGPDLVSLYLPDELGDTQELLDRIRRLGSDQKEKHVTKPTAGYL